MMQDLDDLFTDQLNEQLGQQLDHSTPLPPALGLADRLDELRLSGCCQKIAWSKLGSIAYITEDLRQLRVASLRCRRQDASWDTNDYSDPLLRSHISTAYKNSELVHLSWSPSGSELLVSDIYGRIAICTIVIAINRLYAAKVLGDQDDSLNALVGMTWLPIKRPLSLCPVGIKVEGQWRFPISQHEPKGPFNPSLKAALVAVTRGGTVRLIWQGADAQFQEVKHELDGFSTSADLLTHAALYPDKDDTLLLVVHTMAKQIRVYSINIDWQAPKSGEQTANLPTLSFQHLTTADVCAPNMDSTEDPSQIFMSTSMPELELSHLEIIPRRPEMRPEHNTLPTILAVFSHLPNIYSATEMRDVPYSILSRWELREEKPSLDPAFGQLSSKKAGVNDPKEEQVLKRLDDVRVDRIVISVQLQQIGTMVSLAYSDGGFDLRDRALVILPHDETADRVFNLTQLGFSYSTDEPSLNVALSPNSCLKAYFGKDHHLRVLGMSLPPELISMMTDVILDKISAAFTLHTAVAETTYNMGSNTNDDLLMSITKFMDSLTDEQRKYMQAQFLKDLYRNLGVSDKITDGTVEKLLRYAFFCRCLSFQAALGYQGEKASRTLTSKTAWLLMSVRNAAISYAFVLVSKGPHALPGGEIDINKPEILTYLTGLIKWSLTLNDYVLDQFLELNRFIRAHHGFDANLLRERIIQMNNPVIFFIICTVARSFLRYNCLSLRNLAPQTQSPFAKPPSPLAPYYAAMTAAFRIGTIPPPFLETLLGEAESLSKQALASLTELQRQELEMRILVFGEIPEILMPVIQTVLQTHIQTIKEKLGDGEADLAFKDWSILDMRDDLKSRRWRSETPFDGIRKVSLAGGVAGKKVKLRSCPRCGTVMEDILSTSKRLWIHNMWRACFCGGLWTVVPPGEKP